MSIRLYTLTKMAPAFAAPAPPPRAPSRRHVCKPHHAVRRPPLFRVSAHVPYTTADPLTAPRGTRGVRVRPVVILPGYGAPAAAYASMCANLQDTLPPGTPVSVVPVTRATWLRTVGGRPMTPVLRVLDAAVRLAADPEGEGEGVTLVGHSAGGWIARLYLGDEAYDGRAWCGRRFVRQLVCLGTPQCSGEPVTRANMAFVNKAYPGAFWPHVRYCNFAGDAVSVSSPSGAMWRFWQPLWMARVSYILTDPRAADHVTTYGDGMLLLPSLVCCHLCLSLFTATY